MSFVFQWIIFNILHKPPLNHTLHITVTTSPFNLKYGPVQNGMNENGNRSRFLSSHRISSPFEENKEAESDRILLKLTNLVRS